MLSVKGLLGKANFRLPFFLLQEDGDTKTGGCTMTGFAKWCYACDKGSLDQSPCVHCSGGTWAELGPAPALC